MRLTSIIAIFSLFWVLSAFLVLPFGVRTHEEAGEARVPGQADSAPAGFRPKLIAARATVLAALLFGVFYLNYVNRWLPIDQLDMFNKGPPGYKDPDYLTRPRPTPGTSSP